MVLAFVVAGLIVLSAVSLASDRSLVTGPAAPVSGVSTSDSTLESYSFQLSNEINPVSPAFWGLSSTPNHIYGPSTTNNGPSFIQNISQTPIVYQRYPSGDIGEETNLTTGQIYNPSSATPGKSSESISNISTFISQCESLSCRAIIELPLEIESPSTGAYEVSYIENVLGFHPTYWELGNEPSGWTCTGVPWSDWSSSTCGQSDDGAPGHTAFAQLTQSYIAAIRAVDSSAQFVCSGGTGGSSGTADDAWISAVMQANGANCAGIAIHVRPASHGNTSKDYTPAGFLGQLQNFEYNLPGMYQAAAATIASACPNCASTKVFVTEFGSADSNEKSQYGQYVGTWPDIVFQAAQVSQGLSLSAYNLDYFQWYDNGSDSMWTPPTTTGGGTTLMYELWKSVFGQLGTYVVNTTLNGTDGVYSVATTDSNSNSADQTWSLLLVNAQVGVSAEVNLQGSGFPTANPGFVSVWTSSGFDNTTVGDLESAITLPAESIALVSTTGLDSTPVPFYGAVNSSATGNPIVGASIAPNPGSPVLTNSTGGFYDNQLPDGAYSVTVSAAGFVSQTTSIALSGVPVSENFSLIPVQGVTFSESGLPAGVEWYVNITGGPSLSNLTTPDGGSTVSSTLTPGNYAYTVASGDKRWTPSYVSPLVVKGAVPPVLISFSLYTYTTTFIESGLPAGLTWSVSTDVGTNSTVTDGGSDAVTFQEANGTHSYNISDVSGWHQTSRLYSGSFSVNGAPESFPVSFYQVVYSVTFEETGLPAGQFWSVTFAGSSLTNTTDASNGTLTFAPEPNGSYYYSIQPLGDYHEGTVPYSGW